MKTILTFLAMVLFAGSAAAENDCILQLAATLPIKLNADDHIMVPAAVGTNPVELSLDTGSFISGLSKSAVTRLGLTPERIGSNIEITFYGGLPVTEFVSTKDFQLGALHAPSAHLIILPHIDFASDGILGADFLKQFDVDIDYAGGKLNLFLPHRCPGRAVYWTTDVSAIAVVPFTQQAIQEGGVSMDSTTNPYTRKPKDPHILAHVVLDGHDAAAIVDTGASDTTMNFETATEWFGLHENSPGVERINEYVYRYRFKTLTMGGVAVNNATVMLVRRSSSQFDNYTLLLGNDILRHMHVYIDYKERKLYVTAASQH